MKRNYPLLLLMLILSSILSAQTLPDVKNFKISNQSLNQSYSANDANRIYFDFDIKGNYGTDEIKLLLYYNTVSSTNQINLARWNREGDYSNVWPSYYNKSFWLSNYCDISFTTNPGKKFILVVEYGGIQKTLTYTVPYGDSDGDGFNDNVDNCPSTPGTNNGCPLIDLVIENVKVYKNGNPYYNTSGATAPLELTENNYYDFEITVKNIGNSNTNGNISLDLLFCQCTDYPDTFSPIYPINASSNIGTVNSGQLKVHTFSNVYVSSNIGTSGTLYEGQGSYRLYFDVEAAGEISYTNNYRYIPFKYYKNRSQIQPIKSSISSSTKDFNSSNDVINLDVYDFSGKQVVNKRNITENEKQNILTELPKGYYIIKTQETKTVKIRKD